MSRQRDAYITVNRIHKEIRLELREWDVRAEDYIVMESKVAEGPTEVQAWTEARQWSDREGLEVR